MALGGSFSANIKDLLKGSSGFVEQPETETGRDYSGQVDPRAIGNTRDDRLNFTSGVARHMHDVIDDVKSDADDNTNDDDSSLSSHSSHQSS